LLEREEEGELVFGEGGRRKKKMVFLLTSIHVVVAAE